MEERLTALQFEFAAVVAQVTGRNEPVGMPVYIRGPASSVEDALRGITIYDCRPEISTNNGSLLVQAFNYPRGPKLFG